VFSVQSAELTDCFFGKVGAQKSVKYVLLTRPRLASARRRNGVREAFIAFSGKSTYVLSYSHFTKQNQFQPFVNLENPTPVGVNPQAAGLSPSGP
jgi:hypothetical protein